MSTQTIPPEPPDPPFPSGAPYWYWFGGRPSVDFVNTLRERWNRRVECLVTPADLSAWLVQAGLVDQPMRVPRVVLDEARDLREAIDVALAAHVDDTPMPRASVTVIDDWLVHAGTRPQLRIATDGRPLLGQRDEADSPRRALGTIALDAATLLGTPAERDRLRICASDECSARFYDRSPAGLRRWCSMQRCGNVAKARAFRERERLETGP